MARNTRQPNIPESSAAELSMAKYQPLDTADGRFMNWLVVAVLSGAVVWIWWRRRLIEGWREPQYAPLSAQWLQTTG